VLTSLTLVGMVPTDEERGGNQTTDSQRVVRGASKRLASPFQAPYEARSCDSSAPFYGHSRRHAEKHFSAGGVAMALIKRQGTGVKHEVCSSHPRGQR
jgi:hypothetical protein